MQPTSPYRRDRLASPTRRKAPTIPGFRVPPKPKPTPIEKLTVRELRDLHARNARILSQPAPSTSSYIPRIQVEQARIEAQLVELEGMDEIQSSLKSTRINGDDDMSVDQIPEPPTSRTIEAKRKALSRATGNGQTGGFTLQEAIRIEQEAHALDMERRQRLLEKRQRSGLPGEGEVLSRQEREDRILAFMNHKPTDSDLEDEDEDDGDGDENDPASWFEDDQDDGVKGQNIVDPDVAEDFDLSSVIRVDESRMNLYEGRE
ncbi:hypothetical protein FA95DRAFT_1556752 [Auriscalpium vulgare]|uniref:Uncharacterized protein n=1 Tax=Auriscalpium vulgare TaxID=40419 RepID=A0ACB8RZY6_9AGAM|nr:hypothetical protein FA95DRAFT_1556752 [Auriscalpium vulgare]